MAEMYAKLAAGLDRNRKIRKGGADAREFYCWVLRQVALRGSDGFIPLADALDFEYVADELMRPLEQVRAGYEQAVRVELLAVSGDRCGIVGWDDEWSRRASSGQERTAKWRSSKDPASRRDDSTVTRDDATVTVTDDFSRDVERERERERDSRVTDAADAPGAVLRLETSPRARPARPRQAKRLLPDEWTPTLELVAEARSLGVDPNDQATRMRNWARAEGAKKCDWDATFQNWIRRAAEDQPRRGGGVVRPQEYVP
jgi:hypothetical protein